MQIRIFYQNLPFNVVLILCPQWTMTILIYNLYKVTCYSVLAWQKNNWKLFISLKKKMKQVHNMHDTLYNFIQYEVTICVFIFTIIIISFYNLFCTYTAVIQKKKTKNTDAFAFSVTFVPKVTRFFLNK